jgi:hypothetical protein
VHPKIHHKVCAFHLNTRQWLQHVTSARQLDLKLYVGDHMVICHLVEGLVHPQTHGLISVLYIFNIKSELKYRKFCIQIPTKVLITMAEIFLDYYILFTYLWTVLKFCLCHLWTDTKSHIFGKYFFKQHKCDMFQLLCSWNCNSWTTVWPTM